MNQPRPESRIGSLEKRATAVEATVVELSNDTSEELRAISQDLKKLFDHTQKGFDQAHAYIDEHLAELKATQDEQGQKLDLILQLLQKKGE